MHEGKTNNIVYLPRHDEALLKEASDLSDRYGKNPYSDFVLMNGCRPPAAVAAAIGKLLGTRLRASDGSLQPTKSKSERAADKMRRKLENSEKNIDENLNRVLDAIALIAQNHADPIALIHRISAFEHEEIAGNLEKAVNWLTRFADQWHRHVENGFVQTQNIASRRDDEARPRRLHLVGESDCRS